MPTETAIGPTFPTISTQLDGYVASRGFQGANRLVGLMCVSALCWVAAVVVAVWVL